MNAEEILLAAVEKKTPAERAAYLDGSCGPDEALRARVEGLLKSHQQAGSFLEQPLFEPTATIDQLPDPEKPGTVIGPYKLLQQIGEGGMGIVFMAEQIRPVQRKVALKVIKAGMDSRQVIARFEAERQALAMMDHVNIARVLDAGATEAGRPYFVMELVHGVPITKYCDDNRLAPRARLELFVPVCHAIQHAHQKGIIHRDIKPNNVMITLYDGKPVPKVIDFGVAKATEQRLTERTLFTQYGTMVGTLEYMSPEQAEMSALGVDTRSDVFSLGVLLYELLTGSTPFDKERFEQANYDEIRRIIREEDPPTPSTRLSASKETLPFISAQRHTEPAQLTKLVRGELDWIVMKSLEKDRNRRYETASGFARDVQRYLADETVQACPPSATYRLKKFARRNKGKLATAVVLGLASLLAVSAIGWAVRDRSVRDEEAKRVQVARQARVVGQVQLILDEVAQLEREQKWPEALDTARRAADLLTGSEAEAEVPGQVQKAIRALELARLLEEIRADKSEWKESRFDYRGTAERYAAAFRDGGIDLARLTPEEATDRLRSRSAVLAALIPALDDWAVCRNSTGDKRGGQSVRQVAGLVDPDPWRQKFRQALGPMDQKALLALAAAPDLARQPAATFAHLGVALRFVGRVDAAIDVLLLARRQHPSDFWVHFDLAQALVSENPPNLEQAAGCYRTALGLRPRNTATWNNLGNVLWKQGQRDEAIDCYSKAIELDPKFASAYVCLGRSLFERKKLDDALACFRRAIELNPKNATAHSNLGIVLAAQNKLDAAIASYQKAIEFDPKNANAHHGIGTALYRQGKVDDASASHQRAVELDPTNADAHHNLANALWQQGRLDDAVASYQRAIELDPTNARIHSNLGNVLNRQGKLDDASACFRKAIELEPTFASAHYNLGVVLLAQKKTEDAIQSFNSALERDPKNAMIHNYVGNARLEQKRLDDANAWYRQSIALNPKYAGAHCNLGYVLSLQGKIDDAIACYKKAIELDPTLATAHAKLGAILCDQKKDYDGAVAAFRKAIALQPDVPGTHFNLGLALRLKGDLSGAIGPFREAIRLQPTFAKAHTFLARCLANGSDLNHRNPQEALQAAKKAVELAPESDSAWLVLGWANYRVGEWKTSIAALEKSVALQADPKGGDANQWFFLAMAHWQSGGKDDARRWYDQAIAWMKKDAPDNDELRRIRDEAEEVLKIKKD